jgi:hypothetical protein
MESNDLLRSNNGKLYRDGMESDEYITKYPTPDKQYEGAMKYETYESLQTGAERNNAKGSKMKKKGMAAKCARRLVRRCQEGYGKWVSVSKWLSLQRGKEQKARTQKVALTPRVVPLLKRRG